MELDGATDRSTHADPSMHLRKRKYFHSRGVIVSPASVVRESDGQSRRAAIRFARTN